MRLLRVEPSRLFSRRAVVLLLLAAALLTALVAGTTIWNTRPVSAGDLVRAKAHLQETLSQPGFHHELRTCRAHPSSTSARAPVSPTASATWSRARPTTSTGRPSTSNRSGRTTASRFSCW